MKVRVILVMSLLTLGSSSSAPAEPWLRSIFGNAAPQRPPGLIEGVAHPYQPIVRSRPAAAPADKPSQKPAAAPKPANLNVVTIGPLVPARAADPTPTGGTPKTPSFPPAP